MGDTKTSFEVYLFNSSVHEYKYFLVAINAALDLHKTNYKMNLKM